MKKRTLALLLILALVCTLCACGDQKNETTTETTTDPVNMCFLFAIADGETKILSDNIAAEVSELLARPNSTYAFVNAEGTPTTIGEPSKISDASSYGYSADRTKALEAEMEASFLDKVSSYEPTSDEIDLGAAIKLAVRQIEAKAVEGRENILVVYSSGRSTSGLIDMTQTSLSNLDVESSTKEIAESLGDMSCIDSCVWYCLGDVGSDSDQTPFSDQEVEILEDFYKTLFVKCGMLEENIHFKKDLPSSECYAFDNISVTPVSTSGTQNELQELIPLEEVDFEKEEEVSDTDTDTASDEVEEEAEEPDILEKGIVIPEETVGYKADSAQFADTEAATAALEPLASYLVEHENAEVLVYSTTAGESDSESAMALAAERSQAICSVLESYGVKSTQMTVASVSYTEDPHYKLGLGLSDAASVNRKTVIVGIDSELAKQILDS